MENDKMKSKEVQKVLKIRSCELMHLRENGTLRASKKGNAYYYEKEDVKELLKQKELEK